MRLPSWLTGCWEQRAENRVVEERWTAPRSGSMLGMGSTYRGDSLVESDWVVLRARAGELAYEAHPSGQPSATFVAREISDSTVVFENTAHDFPQRIGYVRHGADSLLAWIEGPARGATRRVEFPYERTPCPQ